MPAFSTKYPFTPLFFVPEGKRTENRLKTTRKGWYATHMAGTAFSAQQIQAMGLAYQVNRFALPAFDIINGKSSIVGLVHICETTLENCNEWCIPGCWHWQIDQSIVLHTPIPCPGNLDVWI